MSKTTDPYEELAAMFLTDGDKPRDGASRTATTVELLVVGHLPVRAGLWLLPYIDQVARERGSAALLRLDGEAPWLKRIGAAPPAPPRDPVTLREALDTVCRETASWVIRPALDDNWTELVRAGADRITIISGANDAAVYKAYEIVKGIAAAAEGARITRPEVGMAFMGVEEASAEDALRRINDTSAEFIGVRIPMIACVPRIDAVSPPVFDRQFAREVCPGIADVVRWIKLRGDAGDLPEAAPPLTVHEDADVHADAWADDWADAPATAAQPPSAAVPTTPATPTAPARPAPVVEIHRASETTVNRGRTIKLRPKVRAELEPKQPVPMSEPTVDGRPVPLASHVDGLAPLTARCPGHEHVELAVDSSGVIHLLGREQSLRDMCYVEAWVRAHRELLAMACPQQPIDPVGRAVCHLFTHQPTEVADLHGSDLCLHVRAPVSINGQTGWYVAALNRP